jgi:hypothetical protein
MSQQSRKHKTCLYVCATLMIRETGDKLKKHEKSESRGKKEE